MASAHRGARRSAALLVSALWLASAASARAADTFEQVPGVLVKIAVGNAQSVWGVNSANQVWKLDPTTRLFGQVAGTMTSISVGGDGEAWGLGPAGEIYRYNSGKRAFDRISGALVKIAVGSAQNVWGVNSLQEVYRFDVMTRLFVRIPGTLASITAGGVSGVAWGLDLLGQIFHYDGTRNAFVVVPGALVSVVTAYDGTTWGINSVGSIYRYNGLINQFLKVSGALATVAVGGSLNVWGINSAQQIFKLNTTTQTFGQVTGFLVSVAVGADGAVWGLNSAGRIWTLAGACGVAGSACCARDACAASLMCDLSGRCVQNDWPLASDYLYQGDALADVEYNWTEETQGMAAGPGGIWWISQDDCIRPVSGGAPLRANLADCMFRGWGHVGDIDYDGGYVYAPIEASTGRYVARMGQSGEGLAAAIVSQPELPWLAVNAKNGLLYGSEFHVTSADGATPSQRGGLYAYAVQASPFALIPAGRIPLLDENGNLLNLSKVQGGDFSDSGKLYLTTDEVGDHSIHVFSVGPGYARRIARLPVPVADVCFWRVTTPFSDDCIDYEELEGIAVKPNYVSGVYGELHVVMLHNQADSDNVYWKVWRLSSTSRGKI